ncbi:SMC-Scp complex subunit ScpB [Pelagibius sp. 7325]|uniref:SMC-Scp complex subunit ScpB n=1 Tax=Pelagibius sp. 7325 TaxID=3131994 RepID=UPI00351CE3B2
MTAETPEAELPEVDMVESDVPETEMAEFEAAEMDAAGSDADRDGDEAGEEDYDVEDDLAAQADEADADEAAADDGEEADFEDGDADDEEADDDEAEDEDAEAAAGGDDEEATDFDNLRLVEALLFASAEPLAPAQLARFLPDETNVTALLNDLEQLYANRGVNLVKRGGRWAFRTAPDLAPRMELENKVVRKLSRVALETLAVIAYHQPVTRAEIEEIRGVALSKGTLDALLEIGWIRPKGRRKTPGRPVTWGTSESFLDHFGLEGLDALPGVEELKAAGLLDARPAITALGDRGLLPAAGEISPEVVDEDDEDDGEMTEASERELLEETFGENLLPQEVDLAARAEAAEASDDEETADDESADDESSDVEDGDPEDADEAEDEDGLEAHADDDAEAEAADVEDADYDDADDDDDADAEAGGDAEEGGDDDDFAQRRQRSAG